MPASILINQATIPAGTAGKARSDGVIAQLVTCTNNTVETTYLWTLVDVPIRSALVRGTTGTSSSFTFTPDVLGTYLVSLRVNGSVAPGDNDRSYIAIRSTTQGWRYQAAGETDEDNETYPGLGFPGNVNPRGWATNEDLIFEEVEESVSETQGAISTFGGVQEKLVKTDPATGKISPTLVPGSPPTGPAGGDLAGTYPNPTIASLKGRALSAVFNPLDGQVLQWNSAGSAFRPANIAVSAGLGAISAGTNQATSGTVSFANSNNVTFGMNGVGVITASIAGGGGGGGIGAAAGTQTATSGTIVFANSNNITFGMSGSSQITGSIPAGATATGNFGAIGAGTQTQTSGTIVLSNSNGLSFGLDAGTITGSYTVPSTAGLISNINLSAGTTSNNLSAFTLSNSNNISFGLNGSVVTASASYSQSTAPSAFAAGTQTGTSGTLNFVNSNGLTFGLSGSSQITGSYTVPSTAGLLSNIRVSAGTTSNLLSQFTLSNSNNLSFGLNGSVITGSASFAQSTAPAALAAGTQTATSGTVAFVNSNGLTFGMSGSSQITASYTVPSTAGLLSNINLSAGTTSTNASAFTFSNSNNVSFGLNGGTVTASASYSQSTAPSAIAVNALTTYTSGTIVFSNGNGVTFGTNGQTITASVNPGGGGGIAAAAGTQTATSGTVNFANSNGLTFGMSGSSQITASYSQSTAPSAIAINALTTYTSGTVVFSNGNNVTFGTNAQTVTASIPAGATATGNFGALGAGTQTATSGTVTFANSNGISFGMSGSNQITASYTVPSTAGLLSNINLSAGTTSANLSAFTASNSNNVSFGLNAGVLTASASYSQSTAPSGIAVNALTTYTSGNVVFSNGNGVTFGTNGQTITASVNPGGGGGIAAAAGTQTATSGTINFVNSNGLTFGMSNSSQITASYSQSTGVQALSFQGPGSVYSSGTVVFPDTANVSWSTNAGSVVPIPFIRAEGNGTTVMASRLSFVNSNGVTLGVSSGAGAASITASVASSLTNINVSAGTTSNNLSALTFANGGGISFGLNNGTITATVVPGAAAGVGAISAGTESVTNGTVLFSNANGISFGLNNSSLTASVQLNATISSYEPFPLHNTGTAALSWATNTSAPMSLIPIVFVQDVAADVVNVVASMSFQTGGTSSYNQSGTLGWGLYSRLNQTGSLLALMNSSSFSYAVSYNNSTITIAQVTETKGAGGYNTNTVSSAGLNISSGYTGLKLIQLNLGSTITPGQYWLGIHHRNSSSSFNSGLRMSFIGNAQTLTGLAPMGSFSSAYSTGTNVSRYGGQGGNFLLAHGSYSINAMTALTASVSLSQVTQNLTVVPYMKFIAPVT